MPEYAHLEPAIVGPFRRCREETSRPPSTVPPRAGRPGFYLPSIRQGPAEPTTDIRLIRGPV